MNEKFYQLPEEKQNRILNAGFRVFANNSYRKSPMNEIAAEAGISKSLLFFYFKNKKELYLFLMETAEKLTRQYVTRAGCYQEKDIFEMMYKGLLAKTEMMRKYPDMSAFALKAYYEDDEEVKGELVKIIEPYSKLQTNTTLPKLDPSLFKEGIDLKMMYQDIYLASEGYLYQMQHKGPIDIDKVVADYRGLIDFWKKMYLK
ncbi:MAG TPA: TetR/AcrR family transcriptional regulator [Clostridiales bacterium]|nr:TetR/AcrR family transcriptional regulator [Saccharofermentanaceae bacterium]HBY32382.1 TetR/AcrR family transcriptional regulator [Clostridiales bacterium]HBZ78315.1 TetR/AcrR family transcriptional regulator [Clostridiales bacterium]